MRVYISVDMEGVAGVATIEQVVRGQPGYPLAARLMTAEANAAAAGAFDAGAESVLVNDSHGSMDNLILDELDPRIELVNGAPKIDGMVEGIGAEHGIAFFVGYHAAAGGPGVLAHTFSPHFLEVRVNGRPVSEAEVNALLAAAAGVPVGLITGDDVTCRTATATLGPVQTVVVKSARGHTSAQSVPPQRACELIRAAAATALENAEQRRPIAVPARFVVEIDMPVVTAAERAAMLAGVERIGQLTVRAVHARPRDVVGFVSVCSQLAAAALRARIALIGR